MSGGFWVLIGLWILSGLVVAWYWGKIARRMDRDADDQQWSSAWDPRPSDLHREAEAAERNVERIEAWGHKRPHFNRKPRDDQEAP